MTKSPYLMMVDYLQNNYTFVYNSVLNKFAKKNTRTETLTYLDYSLNALWGEVLMENMRVTKPMITAYLSSDMCVKIDPFKDYFEALPKWMPEQPDYIKLLVDTITVSDAEGGQWEMYLRRWLIATVACSINAEITNQEVLTLVGMQGIGKTKWTEQLVPKKLKEYYYSGHVNPQSKDSSINLSECFLINLDELSNLNKGDLNSLKQLITTSSVRIRRPYGSLNDNMPRRASFVGAVNNMDFLRDDTGNRRYLCVEAKTIDYAHNIDMDLVYAQAYYLLAQGEKYWFDGGEIAAINVANDKYRVQPIELEYVNEYFEPHTGEGQPDMELTTTGIQAYLLRHRVHIDNINPVRLGKALMSSDYVRVKKNGGTYYYKLKLRRQAVS